MSKPPINTKFAGSIPVHYDEGLGPVLFEPHADDLIARIRRLPTPERVLELACGTGIVSRKLRAALPAATRLVCTDLSSGMIDIARRRAADDPAIAGRPIEWAVEDMTKLTLPDRSFDVVVCQFGVMFPQDKDAMYREMHRVLRPGGRLVFNTWDDLAHNGFGRIAHDTISKFFASNPPLFYTVPFGYCDQPAIRAALGRHGFRDVAIDHVALSAAADGAAFARGLIRGNPTIAEIEERGTAAPAVVEAEIQRGLAAECGTPMRVRMSAFAITAIA